MAAELFGEIVSLSVLFELKSNLEVNSAAEVKVLKQKRLGIPGMTERDKGKL